MEDCHGKVKHKTKGDALKAKRKFPYLRSYYCESCRAWHVGCPIDKRKRRSND
jgi:hypothetical protein